MLHTYRKAEEAKKYYRVISLPDKETVSRALDGNPGNAWTRAGSGHGKPGPAISGGLVTPAGEGRAACKELRLGVKRTGTQLSCSSHSRKGAFRKEAPCTTVSYIPRREAERTHLRGESRSHTAPVPECVSGCQPARDPPQGSESRIST